MPLLDRPALPAPPFFSWRAAVDSQGVHRCDRGARCKRDCYITALALRLVYLGRRQPVVGEAVGELWYYDRR